MKTITQIGLSLILATLACFYAQVATAEVKIQQASFGENAIAKPTDAIRFQLDRLVSPAEGRLAIFIGRTDVTSQFQVVGTEFIYQPGIFPLPVGENQLTIYLFGCHYTARCTTFWTVG